MTEWQTNRKTSLSDTAGPEQYIPRDASERILARLESALGCGDRFIVLSGPPGLGKTLLLRVMEERQRAERPVIFSPFLHFPPDGARVWLRELLRNEGMATAEDSSQPAVPQGMTSERPLLLILDEAQSIPVETAADLTGILTELAPRASVLLAGMEGAALDEVVRSIGVPVEHVRLESRFSREETRELLDRAMEPEADESAGSSGHSEAEADTYHTAAEGNPRILKTLMFRAERGELPPAPPIEASESQVGLEGASEAPLAPDAGAESESSMVGIDLSITAPVEPESQVALEIGAGSETSEALSGDVELQGATESDFDRTLGHGSSRPRRLEQGEPAARIESKRAAVRRRRLELLTVATALGIGFVVARLVVSSAPPPTLLAMPDVRSASLSEVSAPQPQRIAPTAGDPAARPSSSAVASLDGERADRAPTAVVAPSVVTLHINARPWASIRLDGETIGMTPLSHFETRPGRYELEAKFPDGRIVKRVVEVGPESRFISFP